MTENCNKMTIFPEMPPPTNFNPRSTTAVITPAQGVCLKGNDEGDNHPPTHGPNDPYEPLIEILFCTFSNKINLKTMDRINNESKFR